MESTTTPHPGETSEEVDPQGETPNNTTEPGETPESTEPTTQQSSADDRKEIERLRASLKRANAEAKTSREQAAELAKFKEQTEAATLSEQQKQELAKQNLEKQLAEVQSRESEAARQLQEERNTRALERAGRGAGIADPVALDDAIGIALKSADLEHDEQGKPVNADEVMKQIVKSRPWFLPQQDKKAPPSSGGATNPPRSTTNTPAQLSWETIGKLKPEEYEARRAEIQQWMNDPKNHYKRF